MKTFIVAAVVAVVLAVTCKDSSAAPAPQFNFGHSSFGFQPSVPNYGSPFNNPSPFDRPFNNPSPFDRPFNNPSPFDRPVNNPSPFDRPVNNPSSFDRPVINLPPYKEPTLIDRLKDPFVDNNRRCNPTVGGVPGGGFGVSVGVECKW